MNLEHILYKPSLYLLVGCFTLLSLTGCGQVAHKSADVYDGLPQAILSWHADVEKTAACSGKPTAGGNGCQAFEVGCKVEQPIGPAEVGVTARILAAMSWSAWNAARGDFDPASGGAVFTKTNGNWARRDLSTPVNLTTCATS